MTRHGHFKKLKNAPLQEVIFDVRWVLEIDEYNFQYDPGFMLAAGIFKQNIRKLFPVTETLESDNVPNSLLVYRPKFRFRVAEGDWPVVQIGPGMMSVNDTDRHYEWDANFRPNIQLALDALFDNYGNGIDVEELSLRYIDAIPIPEGGDILEFIQKKLQIKIVRGFSSPGNFAKVNYNEASQLEDGSVLGVSVSTGSRVRDNEDVLIWQTSVTLKKCLDNGAIGDWVEHAHEITSGLFREMVSKELYESFTR